MLTLQYLKEELAYPFLEIKPKMSAEEIFIKRLGLVILVSDKLFIIDSDPSAY